MNIVKATVVTNCKDDPYWRVRVKAQGVWTEQSELIPALNSIYLDVNDEVLVGYDDNLYCPIILGKLYTESQKGADPVQGAPVLFKASKDGNWIAATLQDTELVIQTSGGTKVYLQDKALGAEIESVKVKATSVEVEADTALVKATDIELKGSVKHEGIATPNQKGAWCGIPACLFSGAPHTSDQTQG